MTKFRFPDLYFNHTYMRKIWFPCLLLISIISCQKELSIEDGSVVPPGLPSLGNNCKVNQIIAADSLTGRGLFSIFTRFNSLGIGDKVEVFDSIQSALQFEANLRYIGDTIRLSPTDYFLLDANKRVKGFQTVEFSANTTDSDTLTYVYNYDGNGYLVNKEISVSGIPVPVLRFRYTWSGLNLVAVDGSVAIPGINQKVLTATLEYEPILTAKNFIHILPDGFETSLYIMSLDLGKKSRNLVKKTTVTVYDDSGNVRDVYTATYGNYKFSADGYLLEWFVSGGDTNVLPFQNGRTLFKYFCR